MNNSFELLLKSLQNLEDIIDNKPSDEKDSNLFFENQNLKKELEQCRLNYQILQKTSKEILDELNNSIKVIEEYFENKNATDKNS